MNPKCEYTTINGLRKKKVKKRRKKRETRFIVLQRLDLRSPKALIASERLLSPSSSDAGRKKVIGAVSLSFTLRSLKQERKQEREPKNVGLPFFCIGNVKKMTEQKALLHGPFEAVSSATI